MSDEIPKASFSPPFRMIECLHFLVCLLAFAAASPGPVPASELVLLPCKDTTLWGYISPDGCWKIHPMFTAATRFQNHLAVAQIDDRIGLIDPSGKFVAPPFKLHPAKFWLTAPELAGELLPYPLPPDSRYGYISRGGEIRIPARFLLATPFSEGLAAVSFRKLSGPRRRDPRDWGCIDPSGTVKVQPRFSSIGAFSSGLAPASLGDRHGYINRRGRFAIPPRYSSAACFAHDIAVVTQKASGSKQGIIDTRGRWIVRPSLTWANIEEAFGAGRFPACKDGRVGFLSPSGNWLIEPAFEGAGRFSSGLAPADSKGKLGYIGLDGKWVIEPQFIAAEPFCEGFAVVARTSGTGARYGVITPKGQFLVRCTHQFIGSFDQGYAFIEGKNWMGYLTPSGEIVSPTRGRILESAAESSREQPKR